MTQHAPIKAFRATIVDFIEDPSRLDKPESAMRCFTDGLLVVKDGKVLEVGPFATLRGKFPELPYTDYSSCLLMPGFIDTHTHFAQMEMMASFGLTLLDWLNTYTFPTEAKFKDSVYAAGIAKFFIKELLKQGTTSAMVFATSHKESVTALFAAAAAVGMRLITGKVLMDQNGPANLLDTPASAYKDSTELIEAWHKQDRLLYGVTPRFVPTCSVQELEVARKLCQEHPDVYLQTHLAENRDEVVWVKKLFPHIPTYLGVYDHFGLVGERSLFAHCIYLENSDWSLLSKRGGVVAHCPSSNLFLGSGLFPWRSARAEQVRISIGTDIGAGTSLSLLASLGDAYKVAALQGCPLSPYEAFYLLTLGGARALQLEHVLGNFMVGKEADFVVLDPSATPLQSLRLREKSSLADQLFTLMVMGDDRNVRATYLQGQLAYGPCGQ